jgi:hypothetical protein
VITMLRLVPKANRKNSRTSVALDACMAAFYPPPDAVRAGLRFQLLPAVVNEP